MGNTSFLIKLFLHFLFFFASGFICAQVRKNEKIIVVNELNKIKHNIISLTDTNVNLYVNKDVYNVIDLKNIDVNYWNYKRLDSLLLNRGSFPDFVVSNDEIYVNYIDSLNKLKYNKVDVQLNGVSLNEVNWKELSNVITTGPFITTSLQLSPKKRGFWFLPDIFNFSADNLQGTKVFDAFKYELNEELRISIPLKRIVLNAMPNNDKQTYNNVEFVDDRKRGKVAKFNGVTSYIDVKTLVDIDFKEFSISAWVKPSVSSGILSIVGKGEVFSAKLNNGRLQFTTPKIKDHFSNDIVIKPNEWSHIAYVYIPNNKVLFYVNGNLVAEAKASTIEQTDHSILVGTNLWGENYKGLMSELNIWTRALSDNEINEVFTSGVYIEKDNNSKLLYIIIIGFLLLLIVVLFLFNKKRKHIIEKQESPLKLDFKEEQIQVQYNIQCLGGFKIVNNDNDDLTHKFSPKRKELLLLLLLYTLREEGITSKKMGDILWPAFSPFNVKNNRSTQIKKIRNILKDCLFVDILYSDKRWKLVYSENVLIDIVELQKLIPNMFKFNKNLKEVNIQEIVKIINLGPLLPNIELDWIDEFKAQYDNVVLDILIPHLNLRNEHTESDMLDIANAILVIDPLYEHALKVKIEVLITQGKHTSVKKEIEHFNRLYEEFYKEPYNKEHIIKKQ